MLGMAGGQLADSELLGRQLRRGCCRCRRRRDCGRRAAAVRAGSADEDADDDAEQQRDDADERGDGHGDGLVAECSRAAAGCGARLAAA